MLSKYCGRLSPLHNKLTKVSKQIIFDSTCILSNSFTNALFFFVSGFNQVYHVCIRSEVVYQHIIIFSPLLPCHRKSMKNARRISGLYRLSAYNFKHLYIVYYHVSAVCTLYNTSFAFGRYDFHPRGQ
jgi:hypothetical protein